MGDVRSFYLFVPVGLKVTHEDVLRPLPSSRQAPWGPAQHPSLVPAPDPPLRPCPTPTGQRSLLTRECPPRPKGVVGPARRPRLAPPPARSETRPAPDHVPASEGHRKGQNVLLEVGARGIGGGAVPFAVGGPCRDKTSQHFSQSAKTKLFAIRTLSDNEGATRAGRLCGIGWPLR